MDKYLSQKIKRVSFLLMVMVVFLHSYNIDIKQGGKVLSFEKDWNWLIQNFISNGLTRIAVPMFFVVSGYLFFLDQKFELHEIWTKIKKRFSTLVLPYLIWTLLGLLLYFTLQSIPQSQSFFTNKLIKEYTFLEWLNAIFNEPIPYQLWFLKDLIVMVFLSPMLYFAVKKGRAIFLLAVFGFWLFNQDTVFLTSEALLFFSLGIYLNIAPKKAIEVSSKTTLLIVLSWMGLLFAKTTLGFYGAPEIYQVFCLKAAIIVGLLAFWLWYDWFAKSKIKAPNFDQWAGLSFFLYAFHEPFFTIIKKGFFSMLPKTPTSYFLVYTIAPLLIICIALIIGKILRDRLKPFYLLLTGNR